MLKEISCGQNETTFFVSFSFLPIFSHDILVLLIGPSELKRFNFSWDDERAEQQNQNDTAKKQQKEEREKEIVCLKIMDCIVDHI